MHAHDRTLLASLGFADPDRAERRHTLACQYLASPAVHARVASLLAAPLAARPPDEEIVRRFGRCAPKRGGMEPPALAAPSTEVRLDKGEGQYRTTIGFLDAVLPFATREVYAGESHNWNGTDEGYQERALLWRCAAVVEVKIRPCDAAVILRQLNLYRGYASDARMCASQPDEMQHYAERFGLWWVAATAFDIEPHDVAMLDAAGVTHVRLGAGFDAWCAARAAASDAPRKPSPEL